jgi:hypothetical protein
MWLSLAILSYILLAVSAFLDKYILGGPLPSPKMYSFYTGTFSLAVVLLVPIGLLCSLGGVPFLENIFPDPSELVLIPNIFLIALSFAAGSVFLLALYLYYKGVIEFEVSRIGPIVGAINPLFTLAFIYLFTLIPLNLGFERETLTFYKFLALSFLILGSLALSLQKERAATLRSLKISFLASLFFGLAFVLIKTVYNFLPFWTGFIWIRIGTFIAALVFFFSPEVRAKVFTKKRNFAVKKVAYPFFFGKVSGALATILQNGSIFLAPAIFLPIINALSGVQYVFLILLAFLFFFKFPHILKEEISKKVLVQKTLAVWFIVMGLLFLSF